MIIVLVANDLIAAIQWGTLPDWLGLLISLAAAMVALLGVLVTTAAFVGAALAAYFSYRQARASEQQVHAASTQVEIAKQVRSDALRDADLARGVAARREEAERRRDSLTYSTAVDLRAPILTWAVAKSSSLGDVAFDAVNSLEDVAVSDAGERLLLADQYWGWSWFVVDSSGGQLGPRAATMTLVTEVKNSGETPAHLEYSGDMTPGWNAPVVLMPGESCIFKFRRRFRKADVDASLVPQLKMDAETGEYVLEAPGGGAGSIAYPEWSCSLTWHDSQKRVYETLVLRGAWDCLALRSDGMLALREQFSCFDGGRAQPLPRRYPALE